MAKSGTFSVVIPNTSVFRVDEIAASSATNTSLRVGTGLFSTIDTVGDSDWMRLNLFAGVTYTFNMYWPGGVSPLTDPYILGIYNSFGTLVPNTSNDDFGGSVNSQVTFTPTTSGTYYIAAGAYGSATGNYVLNMTASDVPQTVATTEVINPDSFREGVVDTATDRDWFRANLVSGVQYVFRHNGRVGSNDGTLDDQPRQDH